MTYTIHDPGLLYAAVVTRLASQTGKNIGRVEAPSDKTLPYAVVYPVDDSAPPTSLGDTQEVTVHEFQVTSVGATPQQAEWMQTKVRTALLGWVPTVTGYSFGRVDKIGGQPSQRDDGVQPAQFFATDDYTVFTS